MHGDRAQPCREPVRGAGMQARAGRWLRSTQAYRRMRRQHPLDHGRARGWRGASQLAADGKPSPRTAGFACSRRQLPPSPAPGGRGGASGPLPTHSPEKPRLAEPSRTGVCSFMEERAGPFKQLLAFVCDGRAKITFTTLLL